MQKSVPSDGARDGIRSTLVALGHCITCAPRACRTVARGEAHQAGAHPARLEARTHGAYGDASPLHVVRGLSTSLELVVPPSVCLASQQLLGCPPFSVT